MAQLGPHTCGPYRKPPFIDFSSSTWVIVHYDVYDSFGISTPTLWKNHKYFVKLRGGEQSYILWLPGSIWQKTKSEARPIMPLMQAHMLSGICLFMLFVKNQMSTLTPESKPSSSEWECRNMGSPWGERHLAHEEKTWNFFCEE